MKPSEILDGSVVVIERDGWIQGSYYTEPPHHLPTGEWRKADEKARREAPCCQSGAGYRALTGQAFVSSALTGHGQYDALFKSRAWMRRAIQTRWPDAVSDVEWNDIDGRTKGEVIEMLKLAATMAREAGE